MDYFDNNNVIYLEGKDIDNSNLLFKDKAMILIQSIGCGYCKSAKPEYADAADNNNDCKWFTIEMDTADDNLKNFAKDLPNFRGYPHYVLFNNGKLSKTYEGNRKKDDLIKFIKNN